MKDFKAVRLGGFFFGEIDQMSTRGRKPSADSLKLVHGGAPDTVAVLPEEDQAAGPAQDSPGKSARPGPVKRPKPLIGNKVAQEEYDRIVGELKARRKWLPSFSGGIAIYAQAFADWVEAEKMLANGMTVEGDKIVPTGKVIVSPKGYPIQNPWLAIRNRSQEMMLKVGNDYGLTLVSQVRIVDAQLDLFGGGRKNDNADDHGGKFEKFGR